MVTYVYPGTFCPPHYGHADIARRIASIAGKVTVICSVNPEKNNVWFTPQECKEMWKAYALGDNVEIMTFDEFEWAGKGTIVMVRGIRDEKDLAFEKQVLEYNRKEYGIENYHYIISRQRYLDFSSTKARLMAVNGDVGELEKVVDPRIAAKMIERAKTVGARI